MKINRLVSILSLKNIFVFFINILIFFLFNYIGIKIFLNCVLSFIISTIIYFVISYKYTKNSIKSLFENYLIFLDKLFIILLLQILGLYLGVFLFKLSAYLSMIFIGFISFMVIIPLVYKKAVFLNEVIDDIKVDGKLKWVDLFKGIMIILMVVGHTPTIYGGIIYSFHMAVFFMLFGYLFNVNNESFVDYTVKKFKSLIIPFFKIILVTTVIAVILSSITDIFYVEPIKFSILYDTLRYMVTTDLAGATWFLPTLFFTSLTFKFITDCIYRKVKDVNKVCIYSLIICLFLGLWGYTYYNNHEGLSYNFDLSFLSTYCFALGFFIKTIIKKIDNKYKTLVLFISIIFFVFYQYELVSVNDWLSRLFPNIFMFSAINLSAFYIIRNLCIRLSNLKFKNRLLCYTGRNSIDVLGYHFLGFRVAFYILFLFGIVGIEQTRSLCLFPTRTAYGLLLACFAVVFSLIFGKIINLILGEIYKCIMTMIKKIIEEIKKNYNKYNSKEKEKIIISAFIAFIQVLFSFYLDKYIISYNLNFIYEGWMYFCKIVLFSLLYMAWKSVLLKRIKNLKFILIYLGIMLIFYLLVYPGIWRWDEIVNLGNLSEGRLYFWQHWLSSIYFYLCMSIVPTASGIIFVQVLIMSIIVGHIIGSEYERIGKKALLLYIPLILPAVIDSNFFPIRANICAYMELYILYELISIKKGKISYIKIIILIIITAFLSAWRPENFVYIITIPILLLLFYKESLKKVISVTIIGIVNLGILMNIQSNGLKETYWISNKGNTMYESELYTLSGFVTPFGNLVNVAQEKKQFKDELKEIDKIISIDSIKNKGGLGAFWNDGLKSLTPKELNILKKNYIKLILAYIPDFISERWNMFISSNGYIDDVQMLVGSSAHIYDNKVAMPEDAQNLYAAFRKRYKYNKPINIYTRMKTISILEMKDEKSYNVGNTKLLMIFYNCSLFVFITCIAWIISVIKKKWNIFIIITTLAAKFWIVFLTAPMPAFMYYFSTYLICGMISTYCIIELCGHIKRKK